MLTRTNGGTAQQTLRHMEPQDTAYTEKKGPVSP